MALAPHDFTAPRRMTSRPPRRMTARPSHLLLGHCPSTLDLNAAHSPVCQLWTCHGKAPKSQAHGVRHGARSRLPRVPTHDANRSGRHLVVCAIPSSSQHLTVCATTSPSRHPTRRASAGGEGSTPNHPAALRLGMQMGFNPPEQHHTAHSPCKRERSQVPLLRITFLGNLQMMVASHVHFGIERLHYVRNRDGTLEYYDE
jgi:hypothetical protein